MCACIHTHAYTRMHTHTCIHTHAYTRMHTHTHMHTHTCIHTHACTHMYSHTLMHTHTHTDARALLTHRPLNQPEGKGISITSTVQYRSTSCRCVVLESVLPVSPPAASSVSVRVWRTAIAAPSVITSWTTWTSSTPTSWVGHRTTSPIMLCGVLFP